VEKSGATTLFEEVNKGSSNVGVVVVPMQAMREEDLGCDSTLSLQYTKFFPNNVINSITLKDALALICDELGVPLPENIRFFRSQMQTIVTKTYKELGIKPIPSKRTEVYLSLSFSTDMCPVICNVYMRHPGFQSPLLALDNPFPMELPENLVGEKWAFVQLPFSSWMNGLKVFSVEIDTSRGSLVLSVGISTRYVYCTYKKIADVWEVAKKACGGLHFLTIQDSLDSNGCVRFWLLLDLPPPPV
ncbi:hypothetical protein GIB67_019388, partial [Kingdonia uniflora]